MARSLPHFHGDVPESRRPGGNLDRGIETLHPGPVHGSPATFQGAASFQLEEISPWGIPFKGNPQRILEVHRGEVLRCNTTHCGGQSCRIECRLETNPVVSGSNHQVGIKRAGCTGNVKVPDQRFSTTQRDTSRKGVQGNPPIGEPARCHEGVPLNRRGSVTPSRRERPVQPDRIDPVPITGLFRRQEQGKGPCVKGPRKLHGSLVAPKIRTADRLENPAAILDHRLLQDQEAVRITEVQGELAECNPVP